jgi:hypothetical protein
LPYHVASLEGVMHGVYLVWLVQERGFAPALVATLLAAGDLCVFALEVPTGWVADRLGHRHSLIVGSAVQVCAMVALWLAATPAGLLTASLLVAIGDAFRSGADEALLYRTCVALGRETDFQTIQARTDAAGLVGLVALLAAGGALVSVAGYTSAWLLEVALSTIGLALASLMVEPPPAVDKPHETGDRDDASEPARTATRMRTFFLLIAPAALLDGVANVAAFLAQTADDVTVPGVTALVAAITLSEAAGAWVASRLGSGTPARAWRDDGRLFLLLSACGAAVSVAALVSSTGAAVAAVALAFPLGLVLPLRAAALQRMAGDGVRARVASLASACDMACTTLGLLAAGAWSARRRNR